MNTRHASPAARPAPPAAIGPGPAAQRWYRLGERGSRLGIAFMMWAYRSLGWRLASWFLYPVVGYFLLRAGAQRRASQEYLRRLRAAYPEAVAGEPGWRSAYAHFLDFARTILDRLAILSGAARHFQVVSHGQELMDRLAARGQGAVLLGSHLGNLDAMRVLAKERGLIINILSFHANSRNISGEFGRLESQGNLRVIEHDPSDIQAVFELMNCVRKGEFVAINGDRIGVRRKGEAERVSWVPFLGRKAPFPQGPLILAGLLECPVLLTFGLRTGERTYHLYAEEFAERVVMPRGSREHRLEQLLGQYARRLEHYCRQAPTQWFNFYDFWSGRA